MKILKRLGIAILGMISIPLIFIEFPFYGIRWILTGKECGELLFARILFTDDFKKYFL